MTPSQKKSVLEFIAEGLGTKKDFAVRQQAFMEKFDLSLDYQLELKPNKAEAIRLSP